MKISRKSSEQATKKRSTFVFRRKHLERIVLYGALVLALVALSNQSDLQRFVKARGFVSSYYKADQLGFFKTLPISLSQLFLPSDLPSLVVDIKFKHFQKLQSQRERSLALGVVIKEGEQYVPAAIRFQGATYKAKLRLKGDLVDHLYGDKWSFRVKLKKGAHIMGMSRFSLQHPWVRGFQGEPLYFESLRQYGVLTPRYLFVRVMVNGNDIGVMALEEHFSKEMLESQSRRDGVIVKFDESPYWESLRLASAVYGFSLPFNHANVPIAAFRQNRVDGSTVLSQQYRTAKGLLRAFVDGKLSARDVFDVDLTGRHLAVSEVWGAEHGIRWHNRRFYFNPISSKLEPIGFDGGAADGLLQHSLAAVVAHEDAFNRMLLADPLLFAVYSQTIRDIYKKFQTENLLESLKGRERKYLKELLPEFYFSYPYPFKFMLRRAKNLTKMGRIAMRAFGEVEECGSSRISGWAIEPRSADNIATVSGAFGVLTANKPSSTLSRINLDSVGVKDAHHGFLGENVSDASNYCGSLFPASDGQPKRSSVVATQESIKDIDSHLSQLLVATTLRQGGEVVLDVKNISPVPLKLLALELVTASGIANDLELPDLVLPRILIPGDGNFTPTSSFIKIPDADGALLDGSKLRLKFSTLAGEKVYSVISSPGVPSLSRNPILVSDVEEQLSQHAFLMWDKEDLKLSVKSGDWEVNHPLIVPWGYSLEIGGDTVLRFSRNSPFIVYGSVNLSGSATSPVTLEGQEGRAWPGVAILGNGQELRSSWKFVEVRNTTGINVPGWSLNAGVTVHRTAIDIGSSKFDTSSAEDALNIVNSSFTIKDSTFTNFASDGFDSDFSEGEISGGFVRGKGGLKGGDGFDFSGSKVTINHTSFDDVSDKAVSVGEGSELTLRNLSIANVGTGVAVKDSSQVVLDGAKIRNASYAAIAVYNKKSEYGPAKMVAENVEILDTSSEVVLQKGSTATLNGKSVQGALLDVESLYQGVKKPVLVK